MHGWRGVGVMGYPAYNVKLKLHNVNPETGEGEIVAKDTTLQVQGFRSYC